MLDPIPRQIAEHCDDDEVFCKECDESMTLEFNEFGGYLYCEACDNSINLKD